MKREGRQRGMVRTHQIVPQPWSSKPETTYKNVIKSPPEAGLFTKVSPKPTNHSKFTGKCSLPRCAGCHMSPASKSKIKAKGTQKLKSSHLVSNYGLVTWRVVDVKPGFKVTGFSASEVLDHLASDYLDYDNDDHHLEVDDVCESSIKNEFDDEDLSFCDVEKVWEQMNEDEGWCLVAEI